MSGIGKTTTTRKPVKIRVLEASIKKAEKEIAKLEGLIFANPLSDWFKARKEYVAEVNRYADDERETHLKIYEHVEKLKEIDKRLKAAGSAHKKQTKNTDKWMKRLTTLTFELRDLRNELFGEQMKNR